MQRVRPIVARFDDLLDQRVFPAVVRYATHRATIFGTMLLLIPLIVFGSVTALALVLGNYTNVVSATVASIVLAQQLAHRHENTQRHDEHAARLTRIEAHLRAATRSQTSPKTSAASLRQNGPTARPGGTSA